MPIDTFLAAEVLALIALLGLSGFFSMSETALISADRVQIRHRREAGDQRAQLLEDIIHDPERFLTTILVGNNVVNISASVLATIIAVRVYGELGPAIATGGMTFLVLVFGEISPKTLAVRHAVGVSLVVARPIKFFEVVLSPIAAVLTFLVALVFKAFGVPPTRKRPFITEEAIQTMLRMGEEQGTIERFERKIIGEVFEFTDQKAVRILTPREHIRWIPVDATLDHALETVLKSGHSRIIVADGDLDHVVGFLHAKDLLRYSDTALRTLTVDEIVRAVYVAKPGVRSSDLLVAMQRAGSQIAILKDDGGHTIGLVSLEDLLEELVGEITDEFDPRHKEGTGEAPPVVEE